jgi:Zn-dependent protease
LKKLRDPQALVAIGLILLAAFALRHSVSSTTLLLLAVIVPSIILHELAHGVVALACGDDTARRAGRLTLNPVRHVDPMGTLVLPALLALSGLGVFGYAKPVPVNPSRMRHPRNDSVLVSLAGPATNLAIAAISVVALHLVEPAATLAAVPGVVDFLGVGGLGIGVRVLYLLGFLNVTLAVFNALPVPPLDGSVLIERLLPRSALPTWWQIRRYAMIGLIVLVLLDPDHVLARIFGPAEQAWARLVA